MLTAPSIVFAGELILPTKGKIQGIKAGQTAPYSGVLLDNIAAAKILTEKNFTDDQWKLKMEYELAKQSARLNLIIESQKVSYLSLQEKHKTLIELKNAEIDRLSKIATNTNDYSTLWATGGIIVGISLTIAVVYAVQAGTK